MVEPLSSLAILGNLTTLIDLSAQVVYYSNILLSTVKDVPTELRDIFKELEIFNELIDQVMNTYNKAPYHGKNVIVIEKAAMNCIGAMNELSTILTSFEGHKWRRMRFTRQLQLVAMTRRIELAEARLSRQRKIFEMVLTVASIDLTRTTQFEESHFENRRRHMELQRPKILEWISKYDFEAPHLDAQAVRFNETGDWIFKNATFVAWMEKHAQILLLEGQAGCGKTVVFSHIVENFRKKEMPGNMAYIYFNVHDKKIQSPPNLVRCLIRQFTADTDETSPAFNLWADYGRYDAIPSLSALLEMLKVLTELQHWSWIFIDAWDIIEPSNRASISSILEQISSWPTVSVLIASRPRFFHISRTDSTPHLKVKLLNDNIRSDIWHFVHWKVRTSMRLSTRPALQQEIIKHLVEGAEGSFLWVSLQVDSVLKQRNPKEMRKALHSNAKSLLHFYMDEKARIFSDDSNSLDLLMTFSILCASSRPLTMKEMQEILAILRGEDPLDTDTLDDPDYILSHCGFFMDMRGELVLFSHHSMLDFWSRLPEIQDHIRALMNLDLDSRFEGLTFSLRSDGHTQEDVDASFSDTASEAFSQLSVDTTLIGSLDHGSEDYSMSSDFSLPAQVAKILMTDDMLCGLVKVAIDVLGAVGFERVLSELLKNFSKTLLSCAERNSQKMAAILIGQHTRRTVSLLRSAVQPDDYRDFRQKASIVKPNAEVDRMVSAWLGHRDIAELSTGPKLSSEREQLGPAVTVSSVPKLEIEETDDNYDEDLQDAWMDLAKVKAFILESSPFMDLRLALTRHINPTSQVMVSDEPVIDPVSSRFPTFLYDLRTFLTEKLSYRDLARMLLTWGAPEIVGGEGFSQGIPDYHKPGNTLFTWTCTCGEVFTDSVLELEPGVAQAWVETFLMSMNPGDENQDSRSKGYFAVLQSPFEAIVEHRPSGQEGQGSRDTQRSSNTLPDYGTFPSSHNFSQSRSQKRRVYAPWDVDIAAPKRRRDKSPADQDQSFIILCVNEDEAHTRLIHYDISSKTNDRSVFKGMKSRYLSERGWRFCLNELASVEWRKFQMYLPNYVHVEILEREEVPECPEGSCSEECRCGCQSLCGGHCGNGCYGYTYTPSKVMQKPPILQTAMMHLLNKPDQHKGLASSTYNRDLLPKRVKELELGLDMQQIEGWGLHFTEKVWRAPITAVKLFSIVGAMATVVFWIDFSKERIPLAGILPGALVLSIFQALAALMEEWATQPLRKKTKKD